METPYTLTLFPYFRLFIVLIVTKTVIKITMMNNRKQKQKSHCRITTQRPRVQRNLHTKFHLNRFSGSSARSPHSVDTGPQTDIDTGPQTDSLLYLQSKYLCQA